jgi:hypothetical protein
MSVQSLYERGTQIRGRKKRRVDALVRLCHARFDDVEEEHSEARGYTCPCKKTRDERYPSKPAGCSIFKLAICGASTRLWAQFYRITS